MVQKGGQMRFTMTWLKKLIEFQGDGICCEGRIQKAETVGKQGLKERGVCTSEKYEKLKKNSETVWSYIIPRNL